MEIYNDILSAINIELTNGEAKPTRVQSLSKLVYDKLVRYLDELEGKKMITQDPLRMTEKGRISCRITTGSMASSLTWA